MTHLRVNHLPKAANSSTQVFNFSVENEGEVEAVLQRYPANYRRSGMIPLLFIAQKQSGNFLSLAAMNKVAEVLGVPPVDVYEVASFYTMFNREPVGRFHLQVCGTTPCMVCGAEKIIHKLQDLLGVHIGQTTPDGLFTLSEVECLGACVNAPMLQLNNEHVYEDLTEESVAKLVDDLRNGKAVLPGPQNGRRNSEGPLGRSSLKENLQAEVRYDRDFAGAKADWERAREEAALAAKAAKDEAMKSTTAKSATEKPSTSVVGETPKPAGENPKAPDEVHKPAEQNKNPKDRVAEPSTQDVSNSEDLKIHKEGDVANKLETPKTQDKLRTTEKLREYTKPRSSSPPSAEIRRVIANDSKTVKERRKVRETKPSDNPPAASTAPDGKATPNSRNKE